MTSLILLAHRVLCTEALHLTLHTRVSSVKWLCLILQLGRTVQRWCARLCNLECCAVRKIAAPALQELCPPPPCLQEPYKASLLMAFQGECMLQSMNSHLSILWSKKKDFLCFWIELRLVLLSGTTPGRRTLWGAQLKQVGNKFWQPRWPFSPAPIH